MNDCQTGARIGQTDRNTIHDPIMYPTTLSFVPISLDRPRVPRPEPRRLANWCLLVSACVLACAAAIALALLVPAAVPPPTDVLLHERPMIPPLPSGAVLALGEDGGMCGGEEEEDAWRSSLLTREESASMCAEI